MCAYVRNKIGPTQSRENIHRRADGHRKIKAKRKARTQKPRDEIKAILSESSIFFCYQSGGSGRGEVGQRLWRPPFDDRPRYRPLEGRVPKGRHVRPAKVRIPSHSRRSPNWRRKTSGKDTRYTNARWTIASRVNQARLKKTADQPE